MSLVDLRSAIAKASSGPSANDEAWRAMWNSFNFGDLLAPAPLSIALLGSVLLIASGDADFSLLQGGSKAENWKFVKNPDSFKSCAMQLVSEGYETFEANHRNFMTLRELTGQIPEVLKNFFVTLKEATPQEISLHAKHQLGDLSSLIKSSVAAAEKAEASFNTLIGLAQEVLLACIAKEGTAEQLLAQRNANLALLKAQKEATDSMISQSAQALRNSQSSVKVAQESFENAVQHLPAGWELVGTSVIESLTNFVISSGNALISHATLAYQMKLAGANLIQPGALGSGPVAAPTIKPATPVDSLPSCVPSTANVSDIGAAYVSPVLAQLNALKTLLYNQNDPAKADYDRVSQGGDYVKTSLTQQKGALDGSKPISGPLLAIVNGALPIIDTLLTKGLAGHNDALLAQYRQAVDAFIQQLQSLSVTSSLVTQTQGTVTAGWINPTTPASPTKPSTEVAINNAKFKVDQTLQLLSASSEAYKQASKDRQRQQAEITKTIQEMSKLQVVQGSIPKIIPLLRKCIACYLTQQGQVSQTVALLKSIQAIAESVIPTSVDSTSETLSSGQTTTLAGVSLSDFQKNIVYQQALSVLKVSVLVNKVAAAYVETSTTYILPAQRKVAEMLQFPQSQNNDPAYIKRLQTQQAAINKGAEETSQKIHSMIGTDQAAFAAAVEKRAQDLTTAVKTAYPGVSGPPPANLVAVSQGYISEVVDRSNDPLTAVTNGLNNLTV